jgi:hypothetical protein
MPWPPAAKTGVTWRRQCCGSGSAVQGLQPPRRGEWPRSTRTTGMGEPSGALPTTDSSACWKTLHLCERHVRRARPASELHSTCYANAPEPPQLPRRREQWSRAVTVGRPTGQGSTTRAKELRLSSTSMDELLRSIAVPICHFRKAAQPSASCSGDIGNPSLRRPTLCRRTLGPPYAIQVGPRCPRSAHPEPC